MFFFFFFKQKTAYEMSIGDRSSDVCSSDLFTRRLSCLLEVAFSLVFGQSHSTKLTTDRLPAREVVAPARERLFLSWSLQQRVEHNAFNLSFARQRLADEITHEAADHDVLAKLGYLGTEEIFDGHIRIFDEGLFEQANSAVEFLEFSFDDLLSNLFRFPLYMSFVDLALGFDQITGNIAATNVKRMRCSNMQRNVFHELAEILVSRHKISLAIHLDEHADLAL